MSTRRALLFSFIDRYASTLVAIVSSMLISRLLTPAEIGVYSVTMVLLTFVSSMRDFGAGQYLVQEKELTPDRVRAAWTVMLATGCAAALVVLLAAHPVAVFYRDPRMFDIMLVVAANFVLNPFGSLTYAWLSREMRFDALAVMRFTSTLAVACTSIGLAWLGWGAISLAFGSLAGIAANGLASMFFRPPHFPWWPGTRHWRRVLAFGGRISATNILTVAVNGAPELLLGRLQTLSTAAMYSRSNGLVMMFHKLILEATLVVAYPMFARESRERGNINASFIRVVAYITALGWAFYLGLALMAHPAVRLLYGWQWDDAILPTRIVALAFVLGLPAALCSPALMAVGGAAAVLRATSLMLLPQLLLTALGASIGLNALAVCAIGWNALMLVVWLRTARRTLKFPWADFGRALTKSAAVAAIAAIAPAAVVWVYGWAPTDRVAPLALAAVGGTLLFVAAVYALDHPLRGELERVRCRLRAGSSVRDGIAS